MKAQTPENTLSCERRWIAPLVNFPEYTTLLTSRPLSTQRSEVEQYLAKNVSGRVLLVSDSSEEIELFVRFCRECEAVDAVEVHYSTSSTKEQVEAEDLTIDESEPFDTLLYHKQKCNWIGRCPDFHRLIPYISAGGTVISKGKWLPRSDKVKLKEIAVTEPFNFKLPQVLCRFHKPDGTLSAYCESNEEPATIEEEAPPGFSVAPADLPSDFNRDGSQVVEFENGWSWHSALFEWVSEQVSDVDRVLNVCTGSNKLGDIRVDILREEQADTKDGVEMATTHQADGQRLPFRKNSVGATVIDPPWKVPPKERAKFFSEAVRVTKPGGRVIHNAWWLPIHPYAVPTDVRATTANVTESSISGPGGISFLGTYEVQELPSNAVEDYTLIDHIERCGVEQARADIRKTQTQQNPVLDPRICSPSNTSSCENCGGHHLAPIDTGGSIAFQCHHCGFRDNSYAILK